MDIFRPELHSFPLRAFLDEAQERLGDEGLSGILGRYGLRFRDLHDTSAWVSLGFVEALLSDVIEAVDDPGFFDRATLRGMTQKYVGPLYPLLCAFGTPRFTYNQLARAAGRVNKTGRWAADEWGRGYVRMSWIPRPGGPQENTPYICRTRRLQLANIPTLFGIAPATVEHPRCVLHGHGVCVYEVRWKEPTADRRSLIGLGLGALVGAGLTWAGTSPEWMMATAAGGFALGGFLLGRTFFLQDVVRQRVQDIEDHNRALDHVTRTNEQRFEELRQAKADVERKVEQRTRELREATRNLSETLQEVQALDRAKTDFFNNVSHELRSPLTLILAPLEDMAAGRSPPGGERTAVQSMRRNASRLLQLINQLLDLAKIDAGKVTINPVPTDIVALVRSIVQGFESAAHKSGVNLSLRSFGHVAPLWVEASWIDSAVTNLISNAVRATPAGKDVRVDVLDRDGNVSVVVSDEGPGIAREDQPKIFERFAQADSSRRVGGTGIGLALVREAARLHGGDVRLASDLGHGTTFTLVLPRRPGPRDVETIQASVSPRHAMELALDEAAAAASSDRPGPSPGAPLALVVEDDVELREYMADVLATRYRVRAAVDGKQGLQLAREVRPDVIVSDVAMPEMDGYELCRSLQATLETRAIPAVLVTARTELASVLEGFEAGARDYVLKPFHGRELLARVDTQIRMQRMARELALRERHAMLGVLAASVAHQVRNPLTTLISGLPAMRARIRHQVDERTREMMDVMIECSERIDRLTLDLLDLSRVDRTSTGKFRPSDGLKAALRLIRPRLASGITLDAQVEESSVIEGRAAEINHAFLNLLDNAVRAVGDGGSIKVAASMRRGYYEVAIGDSGSGVDPALTEQILEPFFTTRPAGEGTGLGLTIARQALVESGGDMQVGRSELGGALFTLRIPCASKLATAGPESQTA